MEIRKHVPEGLAIVFEGPQRIGKTLSMVVWGVDALQMGRRVFSNIQLGFAHEALDFSEIKLRDGPSRFWNGHIMIDELNFYFDGRRSLRSGNIEFGAFLLQQKKQGCNLTGTTHDLYSLDVRFRENYDYLVRPSVYPKYPEVPEVLVMRVENGPLQPRLSKTFTLDCKPFLGLYDTFAVYDPFKNVGKKSKSKPKGRVQLL